ncbi:MAG: cysteine hydrolase, partial [Gemmatimonadales bacterium]|nr:cysteine hydrolase [Gemmatimonadales bacterium]
MTRTIFWDVDTQHDFMKSDGLLYVGGSEEIIPALRALTDYAHAHDITIVASADDHVAGHRELSDAPDFRDTFPLHCMRGTPGQRKIPETTLRNALVIEPEGIERAEVRRRLRAHRGDILLHKHWFDVFTNENVTAVLDVLQPDLIVLYGVALDVCNRYAIDGLLEGRRGTRIALVTDATRAIEPATADALLARWV